MIVTFTEALFQRLDQHQGQILRDRFLCGLCLKVGPRCSSFLVATSCAGKQVRFRIGRWPLISIDEARSIAVGILRDCRLGIHPARPKTRNLPTLLELIPEYCSAKKLKASTQKRYVSIIRTHFIPWMDLPVGALTGGSFDEHCHHFSQSNGNALVEVGRGLIGALIRYVNAVYGLTLQSPFHKLAAAGLMPDRAQPRARLLQEADLPVWRAALDKIGEKQRDYLLLLLYTGLRRDEAYNLTDQSIDFDSGAVFIADTKNGKPHSLPITPLMNEILKRRCSGLSDGEKLFKGISREHLSSMATRQGAPRFMLHDLRKILATVGERLQLGDAVLRRILNHTPPKSDVLHKHYVFLDLQDIVKPLMQIQSTLKTMMQISNAEIVDTGDI